MHEKIKGGPDAAWDQPGVTEGLHQLAKDFAAYTGGAAAMHTSLEKFCAACTKAAKDPRLSGYAGLLKKIGDVHRAAHTSFTAAMGSALTGIAGVLRDATDRSNPDEVRGYTNPNLSYAAKPQGERSDGHPITGNPNHPRNPATGELESRVGDNDPANLFPSQAQDINSAKACMANLCKSLLARGITPIPVKLEDLAQLPLTAQEQEYLVKALVTSNAELCKEWRPELHANLRKAALDGLTDFVKGTKERKLL